jgi:urea-proton symporter
MVAAALSQGFGYGIILGLGAAFGKQFYIRGKDDLPANNDGVAIGMIFTTWALKRYNGELQTSEAFSTAGRTVKSGLVAAAVVSSWTWAATLLQSSGVAYRYGVSGPFCKDSKTETLSLLCFVHHAFFGHMSISDTHLSRLAALGLSSTTTH